MDLIDGLRAEGMHARLVPISRMKDVQHDILELRENGCIDPAVYDRYLARYSYAAPEALPEACSLIIIAVPSPTIRVRFETDQGVVETIVPPTYWRAKEVDRKAVETMQKAAPKAKFERVFLPTKTIATRSGLMLYGRNNNAYVPGLGSFFRLTSFVTDMECTEHDWRERMMLPSCIECTKCIDACPTQAITADRFVIHAERCLTYLNELPSEKGFPAWLSPQVHHALQGCMHCQNACPYDQAVGQMEEGPTFSPAETRTLLQSPEKADTKLVEKLESLGMQISLFPRNLKAIMHQL